MNEKSEQIDLRLNILRDDDQPLSFCELNSHLVRALQKTGLGDTRMESLNLGIPNKRASIFVSYESSELGKHAFLTAAVTFLGGNGNHPLYKKRIQLKEWYKVAYNILSSNGYIVHFLGVYHYNANVIFVDFAPETYLLRKMHNSSAFVYINDLFRAMKDGVAQRTDFHGNVITTIRADSFAIWLTSFQIGTSDLSDLVQVFEKFNAVMPFKKWLKAEDIILQMRDAGWPKWKETEWVGWFLEFKFATYLKDNNISIVEYLGNESKKTNALDFDLWFPIHKFYGDLKASDITLKMAPGNDQKNLMSAIAKFDRFWYIIYEHNTVKDLDEGGKVCKFRYDILQEFDGSGKSPTSYIKRMKNRIYFNRMMILELNRANCGELLFNFFQGVQANGAKRAPKFHIGKQNIENFQVFHYEV